jgi:hypothetical protein
MFDCKPYQNIFVNHRSILVGNRQVALTWNEVVTEMFYPCYRILAFSLRIRPWSTDVLLSGCFAFFLANTPLHLTQSNSLWDIWLGSRAAIANRHHFGWPRFMIAAQRKTLQRLNRLFWPPGECFWVFSWVNEISCVRVSCFLNV